MIIVASKMPDPMICIGGRARFNISRWVVVVALAMLASLVPQLKVHAYCPFSSQGCSAPVNIGVQTAKPGKSDSVLLCRYTVQGP